MPRAARNSDSTLSISLLIGRALPRAGLPVSTSHTDDTPALLRPTMSLFAFRTRRVNTHGQKGSPAGKKNPRDPSRLRLQLRRGRHSRPAPAAPGGLLSFLLSTLSTTPPPRHLQPQAATAIIHTRQAHQDSRTKGPNMLVPHEVERLIERFARNRDAPRAGVAARRPVRRSLGEVGSPLSAANTTRPWSAPSTSTPSSSRSAGTSTTPPDTGHKPRAVITPSHRARLRRAGIGYFAVRPRAHGRGVIRPVFVRRGGLRRAGIQAPWP